MVNDIDECIDLIRRQNELKNLTENDIEDMLDKIRPFLTKRYGKNLMLQVEKLCKYKNFERAIKLINSLPKSRISSFMSKGFSQSMIIFLIVIVGVVVAIISGNEVQEEASNESSWISVEGIVSQSRISSKVSFSSSSSEYYPDIEFSYYINEMRYISDSVNYNSSADPSKIIEDYPEGSEIEVFYNPQNPEEAYINIQDPLPSFIIFINIIIFLTVLFFFFRKGKGKEIYKRIFQK